MSNIRRSNSLLNQTKSSAAKIRQKIINTPALKPLNFGKYLKSDNRQQTTSNVKNRVLSQIHTETNQTEPVHYLTTTPINNNEEQNFVSPNENVFEPEPQVTRWVRQTRRALFTGSYKVIKKNLFNFFQD